MRKKKKKITVWRRPTTFNVNTEQWGNKIFIKDRLRELKRIKQNFCMYYNTA